MPDDTLTYFEADPQRQQLLRAKLGALLTWQKPALTQTVGRYDPSALDPFDAKRKALIQPQNPAPKSYSLAMTYKLLTKVGQSTGPENVGP